MEKKYMAPQVLSHEKIKFETSASTKSNTAPLVELDGDGLFVRDRK